MHWVNQWLYWTSACVLFLVLSCRASGTARYYVRSFLLYFFIFVNAVLSVPYGLLHLGQFRRNTLFSARLSRAWAPFLGVEWRVEEEVPVDGKKPYIIVCNHQSSLDTYGMMRVRRSANL